MFTHSHSRLGDYVEQNSIVCVNTLRLAMVHTATMQPEGSLRRGQSVLRGGMSSLVLGRSGPSGCAASATRVCMENSRFETQPAKTQRGATRAARALDHSSTAGLNDTLLKRLPPVDFYLEPLLPSIWRIMAMSMSSVRAGPVKAASGASRRLTVRVRADKCLIVNTKVWEDMPDRFNAPSHAHCPPIAPENRITSAQAASNGQRPLAVSAGGSMPRAPGLAAAAACTDSALLSDGTAQGGGHAFIGYHLAKQLVAKGHDVTIFNDGDEVSAHSPGLLQRRGERRERPRVASITHGAHRPHGGRRPASSWQPRPLPPLPSPPSPPLPPSPATHCEPGQAERQGALQGVPQPQGRQGCVGQPHRLHRLPRGAL